VVRARSLTFARGFRLMVMLILSLSLLHAAAVTADFRFEILETLEH
jgi:hypothetical protein